MKLTDTPDWEVGTAWLPPGMEIWKVEPWPTDVGELADPVNAS